MIEINLQGCRVEVAGNTNGQKILVFIDSSSGIRVTIPLASEAANQISRALAGSGIIVPTIAPLNTKDRAH